jgi:hypothetical protein
MQEQNAQHNKQYAAALDETKLETRFCHFLSVAKRTKARSVTVVTRRHRSSCGMPGLAYSYLSASIGFNRDAFRAGKNPDTIPTSDRITNEIIIKKQVSKFQGFKVST